MTSVGAELPVSGLYLMPLNRYGLWLAVTTAAPVALQSITVHDATCVGEGRSKIRLRTPLAANTSATVRANSSEAKRQSYPTTATGSLERDFRYSAVPWATRRTLAYVKSSAVMPRHPSVPNLISGRDTA